MVNVEQSQLPSLPPPSGSRRKDHDVYTILAGVLITGIAGFFLSTLRPGHNWDGDYALYIMHARNIIEQAPYAGTGYVFNPQAPIHPAALGSGPKPAKDVAAFIERNRSAFDVVFSNQWFTLYEVSADRATGGLGRPSSIE